MKKAPYSRRKEFIGVELNKYFKFSENTRVVFETNTGFRKVLTSAPPIRCRGMA